MRDHVHTPKGGISGAGGPDGILLIPTRAPAAGARARHLPARLFSQLRSNRPRSPLASLSSNLSLPIRQAGSQALAQTEALAKEGLSAARLLPGGRDQQEA